VALAAFAAAGIAGSNPMKTGFHSFRLGIAKYILPFVFVFAPGMLFVGSWHEILLGIVGGFAGIYALTVATEGWLLDEVGWLIRILMGACALLFFVPGIQLTLLGSSLSLPYFLTHLLAWIILGSVFFIHRSRRSLLALEGT
jgi:TRAP-type uncharacterized transport system fused permease subunit